MRLPRTAVAIPFALVLAMTETTQAATPTQVALDVSPPDSSFIPLLRAELRALGVSVVDGTPGGAAPSVTVHIVLTSELLEVRIVDEPTGRTTVRETFPAMAGTSMDRMAVLHAVELLRWHLRFTPTSGETPPPPVVEPPPTREPVTAPPTSDTRIGIMPFGVYSPGGTRPGAGGQVDVLKRWGHWGARLFVGSVFLANGLSVREGSVEVTPGWGGLAGVLVIGSERATALEVGLGMAVFTNSLRGKANADNIGQDDRLVTGAPFGELRLRHRLTPGFALTLAGAAFVPLRSSRLLVLRSEVGRYGQAVATLGLGVELTLF